MPLLPSLSVSKLPINLSISKAEEKKMVPKALCLIKPPRYQGLPPPEYLRVQEARMFLPKFPQHQRLLPPEYTLGQMVYIPLSRFPQRKRISPPFSIVDHRPCRPKEHDETHSIQPQLLKRWKPYDLFVRSIIKMTSTIWMRPASIGSTFCILHSLRIPHT